MPGLTAASRRRSSSRRTLASFIRARSRRPRSARGRVAPSRRAGSSSLVRPIASHFRALRFIRRRSGARRSARLRSRRHARRGRASAERCRRPAAVRGRAFARNAPGDAAGHATRRRSKSCPFWSATRTPYRRRGAAPGLGRTEDGRRSLVRPVAFSRSDQREHDRFRHRPSHRDARRRRARWSPCLRLLTDQGRARDRCRARHADKRPASGDVGGRGRGRVAGRRLRRFRI